MSPIYHDPAPDRLAEPERLLGNCLWCGAPDTIGTCPRSIECPECHVGPGSPCKRPSGHRAGELHMKRVLAAEGRWTRAVKS